MGLCCCARAFSSCSERGLLFVVVCGLLTAVASPLQSMGSRRVGFSSCGSRALEHRLSSCGAGAQLLCGMSDLSGPGLEPMSPALAGRFSTTAPPGKPVALFLLPLRSLPLILLIMLICLSFELHLLNVIAKSFGTLFYCFPYFV